MILSIIHTINIKTNERIKVQLPAHFDIESLEEDSWYFFFFFDKKVRSRLLMVNRLTEKLYFTNLSGELISSIDFDDKTKQLETITPTKLDEEIRYQQAIRSVTRELTTKLETLELEHEQIKQQTIINEKQQKQAEERTRFAVIRRMAQLRKETLEKEEAKRKLEELKSFKKS